MSYSCTDFTDSIIEALGVEIPEESYDSPSDQADICLEKLEAIFSFLKRVAELEGVPAMMRDEARELVTG